MKKTECIFVIIGYYNSELTNQLIKSFKNYLPNEKLWLYDNSSDPKLKKLAHFFRLPYFVAEKNLGYSGGCNLAIDWILQKQNPVAICVLNNDILINKQFATQFFNSYQYFMTNKKIAAMMPLLFQDRRLQVPENFGIFYYQSGLAFQNRSGNVQENCLLNGAFLFLKTKIIKELISEFGYVFQPSYFFNAEDVELSLRLLSQGYELEIDEKLKATHLGAKSLGKNSYQGVYLGWRNLLWTLFITRSNTELFFDSPFIIIGQIFLFLLSFKYGFPAVIPRIIGESYFKLSELKKLRRTFLKKRKKTLKYIRPGIFYIQHN